MRRLSAEKQGALLGDDPCVLTISVSTRLYKMGGLWLLLLLGLGQRAGGQVRNLLIWGYAKFFGLSKFKKKLGIPV